MKRIILISSLCMATLLVAMSLSPGARSSGKLNIILEHYVGDKPLTLDTVMYTNGLVQPFTVTKFRYYIGNIRLQKKGGGDVVFSDYYLVDEEELASKKIVMNSIPEGEYTGIDFIIGVDSLHNCSGAQSGALDPINAMFWAWNTGYIFLKLEGKSVLSKSPGHIFEYHIGGYKLPHNCIRDVSLKFDQPFLISAGGNRELHLKADVAKVLNSSTAIDFTTLSSVTDFHHATTIADNYSHMFSILSDK